MVATLAPGADNAGAVGFLARGQSAREGLGPGGVSVGPFPVL